MHMLCVIPLFAAFSALVNALAIPITPAVALDGVSVANHDIIKKTPVVIEDHAKENVDITKFQDTVGQLKIKKYHTFKIREESSPPGVPIGDAFSTAANLLGTADGFSRGLKDGLGSERPVTSVGKAVGSVVHDVGGSVSDGANNGVVGGVIGGVANGIL